MDLVLIIYVQTASSSDCRMNLNNDTASNYALQELYGDGSSAGAYANAALGYAKLGIVPETSDGANDFAAIVAHLFDINSGKYKSALSQFASDWDGGGYVGIVAGTWKSQAPISEIDLSASPNFSAGSMFSLFGILPRMVA